MITGPERASTEGTPNAWMPGRRSTLAALDTTEYGMSLDQPSARPAAERRRRERVFIAVCAAITVAALLGLVLLVTGDDEPTATSPAPTTAATSTPPSASPTPATPEDLAAEQAQVRYLEFVQVSDQVAQGGYDDPERYETVAIDPHETQLQIGARRFADQRSTGETEVVSIAVQSVQLDPEGSYPSVTLLACLDVSQVSVVNAAGESVVSPGRLDRLRSQAVLQRIPPGVFTDGREPGWYVAEVVQRGEPC
jgi:hypothetical protein